jgi:hypothetical protein
MMDGYYFQPAKVPVLQHFRREQPEGEAVVHKASGMILGYIWKEPLVQEWSWKTFGAMNAHHGMTATKDAAVDILIRLRGASQSSPPDTPAA